MDIISPNEQNMRLHEEIENIREVLQRSTSEGHALSE